MSYESLYRIGMYLISGVNEHLCNGNRNRSRLGVLFTLRGWCSVTYNASEPSVARQSGMKGQNKLWRSRLWIGRENTHACYVAREAQRG